jgi:hypothetical protein
MESHACRNTTPHTFPNSLVLVKRNLRAVVREMLCQVTLREGGYFAEVQEIVLVWSLFVSNFYVGTL